MTVHLGSGKGTHLSKCSALHRAGMLHLNGSPIRALRQEHQLMDYTNLGGQPHDLQQLPGL